MKTVDQGNIFYFQYLILPSVVGVITVILTAFLSYFATYKLNQSQKENDKRLNTIDLIDKLLTEINRLSNIFDKLREDVVNLNYFSLKNTQIGNSISWKLKTLSDNIILLPDKLRRSSLDVIDTSTALIDEIDGLERYPVNEYTELKSKQLLTDKEYRDFSLKLLDLNIYEKKIGDKFEARYFDDENKNLQNDKKLFVAEAVRADLLSVIRKDEDKLKNINKDIEKRRGYLMIRIVDIQTRLRETVNDLNDTKLILIEKKIKKKN